MVRQCSCGIEDSQTYIPLIPQGLRLPASFSMHNTRISVEDVLMQSHTEHRKAISLKLRTRSPRRILKLKEIMSKVCALQ